MSCASSHETRPPSALTSAAHFLSTAFEQENFRFFGTVLNGTPAQEPRWQRAARVLDGNVGFAVGEIYVAKYFPPEVKGKLEAMIQNMRDVLHDRITRVDWMTAPTKAKALEKLGKLRVVVGYPEKSTRCGVSRNSGRRSGEALRVLHTPSLRASPLERESRSADARIPS